MRGSRDVAMRWLLKKDKNAVLVLVLAASIAAAAARPARAALVETDVYYDVDFNGDTTDQQPVTALYQAGVTNTHPQAVDSDASETATVLASSGGLTDQPVELVSINNSSQKPMLWFAFDQPLTTGIVRLSWESQMLAYTVRNDGQGPVETVFSFKLHSPIDPFAMFTYVNESVDGTGGVVSLDPVGGTTWAVANAERQYTVGGGVDQFEVLLYLDTHEISYKRNDTTLIEKQPFDDGQGRYLQGFQKLEITDGWAIGAGDGTFTVAVDNIRISRMEELPVISISASDPDASEEGPDPGIFRISRTGTTTSALTVNVDVTGDAGASEYVTDPDISGGSVQIAAGEDYVDITITPQSDLEFFEDPESVQITIAAAGAGEYEIGSPDSATVMIANYAPDPPGEFSLSLPADETQNAGLTPTLSWTASTDADSYDVALYDSESMVAGNEVYTANVTAPNTSHAVTSGSLILDQEYWWKVTATNVMGTQDATGSGISFCTSPPGPPAVLSRSPADGAGDIPVSVKVRITFTEPMDEASTEGAFTLLDGDSTEATGEAALTADGMTLVFTPDAKLLEETTYTATLTVAATGLDGKALNAQEVIVFTTQPPLTGYAIGDGCMAAGGTCPAVSWIAVAFALAALLRSHRGAVSPNGFE